MQNHELLNLMDKLIAQGETEEDVNEFFDLCEHLAYTTTESFSFWIDYGTTNGTLTNVIELYKSFDNKPAGTINTMLSIFSHYT
jgi:hypothetical protein